MAGRKRIELRCEQLEERTVPAATAMFAAGTLTVTGTAASDSIRVLLDGANLRVINGSTDIGRFASASVTSIVVKAGAGNDTVRVGDNVTQQARLYGETGGDKLIAGGGPTVLMGGRGTDTLTGGPGGDTFNGGLGVDTLLKVKPTDAVTPDPADKKLTETPPPATGAVSTAQQTLTTAEVAILLQRAAAASSSTDAIIVITDRNGRILGVRVERGVSTAITGNNKKLVFAIDGALALARTGAFFGNNQAPLTSRTVQNISQSTITQREVEADPNITDPNSTLRGPGYVAPVGIKGHFPPGIPNTPQVDLFLIEHTNRDGTFAPGRDGIKGTADDLRLAQRFNLDPNYVPAGQNLTPPDSYGFISGLLPGAQSRGIATLPGGIPIVKFGQVVGGIGVFFPGKTGYATEENSSLSATFDASKPDRTLEAEWIAFAAVGGFQSSIGTVKTFPINNVGGVALPAGFGLPNGRIDLVGITLDLVGPGGQGGLDLIAQVGNAVGRGNPNDGVNKTVSPGVDGIPNTADDKFLRVGRPTPEGWLVLPHDGDGVTAADVTRIIINGINQANLTRAAIRLPAGTRAKFVFAVSDRQGNIVGLYRQPDATIFSIDVAVAKARNVAYYANAAQLQNIDQVPGIPKGVAFTNRTFRYLAEPRFPEGVDGAPPGPFSQLYDGGSNVFTGLQVGPRLPASAFNTVVGYDSFNPGTNFRDPYNFRNHNGVVFFPGSSPLYRIPANGGQATLIGGLGVSGDGVDQDDVATIGAQAGYGANDTTTIFTADLFLFNGVRLPYQKTNRNPEG